MDVQHVRPVGQHGVDVDLLDVRLVGHRVLGHVQLTDMLKRNNIDDKVQRIYLVYFTLI